jgi:hypothetical protein
MTNHEKHRLLWDELARTGAEEGIMNDLAIFKYQEKEVRAKVEIIPDFKGNPYWVRLGEERYNRFDLLSLANMLANKNEKEAWEVLKLASLVFHPIDDPTFDELYEATAMHIAWITNFTEFTIHNYFKENYKELIGKGAILISKKGHRTGSPDAWVEIDGESIPVEIKKKTFNEKALKQLDRYMSVYGCSHGIAMAPTLTTQLPDNITFIAYLGLKPRKAA